MKLFVGNLPFSMGDSELRSLFEGFGQVESAKIATDRDTGRSRGFGFVEMPDGGEADTAIQKLNGSSVSGRTITVNEARSASGGGKGGFRGGSRARDFGGSGGGRGGRDRG